MNRFLQRFPALGYPLYRRYWLASFGSVGATQLVTLGQGWLVFELSGSPLNLGYLGAAASLPSILVSLFGGALADRFNKRLILMTTSGMTALLMLVLALLDFLNLVQVWHVLAIAACVSFITGLDWPTRSAFYPHLIERNGLMSAVALNSFIWQATRMMMPALGGLIIAFSDTSVVFALAAAGFLLMFLVMASIGVNVPGERHHSTLHQVREGFQFIVSNPLFKWLILLSYTSMFFGTAYMQLMPVFADLLNAGETGYGYLLSATGVGSVLGIFFITAAQHSRRLGYIILAGAAAASLGLWGFAAVAYLGNFTLALLLAMLTAVFSSVYMITAMTVLQMAVPDRLRGRVMGIHTITYNLMPLGGLLLGAIATLSTAPIAVFAGASVALLFVLYLFLGQPDIRHIDGDQSLNSAID